MWSTRKDYPSITSPGKATLKLFACFLIAFASNQNIACAEDWKSAKTKAIGHLQKNETKAAGEVLKSAVSKNPKDADLWALMTFCSEKPLECAQKAVQLDSKSDLAYIALGLAEHKINGQTSGLAELTKAIKIRQSSLAYEARGKLYLDSGDVDEKQYEKAVADFSKAIELTPNSAVGYLNRAFANFVHAGTNTDSVVRKKLFSKAIDDCSKAIAVDSHCVDAYILRGRIFDSLQRKKDAIADFSKAIELDPEQNAEVVSNSPLVIFPEVLPYTNYFMGFYSTLGNAYEYRANAYKNAGEHGKAISDLSKLISTKKNLAAYEQRADNYVLLKDYSKSVLDYSDYLTKFDEVRNRNKLSAMDWKRVAAPNRSRVLAKRAGSYLNLNNYAKAQADAQNSIELVEEFNLYSIPAADPYYIRGVCFMKNGKHEKAIADFSKCLELNPSFVAALINRASDYYELKKYREAAADYTTALALGAHGADIFLIRGKCYLEIGDYDKALSDLNKAKILQPDSASVQARFYANRADVFSRQGTHAKAIEDLNQLISINPSNAESYSLRSKEHLQEHNYLEALTDQIRIAILKPLGPGLFVLVAVVFVFFAIKLSKQTKKK